MPFQVRDTSITRKDGASPPAVINAITDALGHEEVAMPATPQVVWRAAQKTMMKRAAD